MLKGQGRATFIDCRFYQPEGPFVPKDFVDPGHPVLICDGNGLTVSGCDFTGFKRNHILLGSRPPQPIAISNCVAGSTQSGLSTHFKK